VTSARSLFSSSRPLPAALKRSVLVSSVDHGISKALYFDDPDGNGLEVYVDTRTENDRWTWDGRNTRFDP